MRDEISNKHFTAATVPFCGEEDVYTTWKKPPDRPYCCTRTIFTQHFLGVCGQGQPLDSVVNLASPMQWHPPPHTLCGRDRCIFSPVDSRVDARGRCTPCPKYHPKTDMTKSLASALHSIHHHFSMTRIPPGEDTKKKKTRRERRSFSRRIESRGIQIVGHCQCCTLPASLFASVCTKRATHSQPHHSKHHQDCDNIIGSQEHHILTPHNSRSMPSTHSEHPILNT